MTVAVRRLGEREDGGDWVCGGGRGFGSGSRVVDPLGLGMETVGIQARVLIFFMELGTRALCLWWCVMCGQRLLGSSIGGDVTTLVVGWWWLLFGAQFMALLLVTGLFSCSTLLQSLSTS